ncbi:MAG TPA: DUF6519 domain-containing protein, partial [Candidatus Binatia bacterium]|nr:DUF6519 domain-containing protein [Candidatus Binatia bacterium]
MPGDYSRKTFHRSKHYSGVLMQQGRVQLDADWNEQLDIQLCRTETEALDVIGSSGVPQESDGFKIGIALGGRDLTISAGRIYVDGILCELEIPASYTTQPYYPNPEFTAPGGSPPSSPPGGALDLVLDGGAYLIFLDAWQRELTALDDRLLREVALGGPDTSARLQNVFQVRLLKIAPISPPQEINCQTAIPDFERLTALSTGKLNARTQPPTDDENLCLLPPSAGYSRLENQLYRVEIHRSTTNLVTFKWSRDNASIETRIEKIEDNVLTVSDVGKDEVLGFAAGQWVEIVDDESTLKGSPRPLLQIDTVDPAARQITLAGSAQDRAHLPNLKLRRWDQIKDANADGVNVAQGNWVDLEGGIQVNFSGGSYRAGDYWLIPARTLTGEIEWPPYEMPNTQPIPQPPRGIRHHYCRLGILEVDDNGVIDSVSDCRNVFPPLTEISAGCCTVVVRPGDSIQAALDSLPDEGGCICLRTGEHEIGAPLRIEKSNVSLHGETLGARVTRREGAELLKVAHPNGLLLENVTVSGIYFEFENKGVQVSGVPALIALDRCANSKVDGCIIRAQELGTFAGTVIGRSTDVQVTNCRVEKARYGLWVVSDSTRLFLSDNVLDATDARKTDGGFVGIFLMDAFGSSSIKENRITGFIFGIALNKGLFIGAPFSLASGSTITGNRIAR